MSDDTIKPKCRVVRNVMVPMRDGVKLATTVFLPESSEPCPAVLARLPYNRKGLWGQAASYAERGYAYVAQDVRGRFDSEGEWYPFLAEAKDGFDTLEWIGRQPWCNGNVGMVGPSYLAGVQWFVAPEASPYLKALIPQFMTGDPWKCAYYCDGAFSLALTFVWLCFEVAARTSDWACVETYNMEKLFRKLPLNGLDIASGCEEIPFYRDYVNHGSYDDYWKALSIREKYHLFDMPVFLIGGWYDYYPTETFANYLGLVRHAPSPHLARRHHVLVGPWTHGFNSQSTLGEIDFGEASVVNQNELCSQWFDQTLKGQAPPDDQAPIRIFVMGANEWHDEWEWPLARTQYVKYYLHSEGAANALSGGRLALDPPSDDPPDRYTYDPENPVPTLGGNHSIIWRGLYDVIQPGPFDQRPTENRDDVLVYTSPPLEQDTEITGPVAVTLYAASSVPDTDFVARLTDVYPDGRSMNLTEGVIRGRFRESVWEPPKLIEPNRIYEYTVNLQATSNVFKKGHRIRVQVTSSNFPLWDRNLNTGNTPGSDTEMRSAHQTIHHDREHPSHILLPVVPRARGCGVCKNPTILQEFGQ